MCSGHRKSVCELQQFQVRRKTSSSGWPGQVQLHRDGFCLSTKSIAQDVLLQVTYFHPGVLNGPSLQQGLPCKLTSLAFLPVVKEMFFLSLSILGSSFMRPSRHRQDPKRLASLALTGSEGPCVQDEKGVVLACLLFLLPFWGRCFFCQFCFPVAMK